MADADLRRLERAASDADPSSRARHLLARVRAGRLARARLELLADLGHEPACTALARAALPARDPCAWLRSLSPHGAVVVVRALWSAGHEAQRAEVPEVVEAAGAQLLWAVEQWLAEPTARRADMVFRVTRDARPHASPPIEHIAQAAWAAAAKSEPDAIEVVLRLAATALRSAEVELGVRPADLIAAMRSGLQAWATADLPGERSEGGS